MWLGRPVAPILVVLLALVAGVGLGAAGMRVWQDYVATARPRVERLEAEVAAWRGRIVATSAQARARGDSLAAVPNLAGSISPTFREIARAQVGTHCAFTVVFTARVGAELLLFQAEDVKARMPGGSMPEVIGQGRVYRAGGFAPGDTARVVVPYVECATALLARTGMERERPPPPVRLGP